MEVIFMNLRKTTVAAKELGISYYRLIGMIRSGKLAAPQKDSSGDYVWTDAEIETARHAMQIDNRWKSKRNPNVVFGTTKPQETDGLNT
jgi:hypothetical protein